MYKSKLKIFGKINTLVGIFVMSVAYSAGVMAAAPGVTAKDINLGAILPLTGVFAAGGKAQLAGYHLYWNRVNKKGGICDGRTVHIIARDHHYNVQKAVTAYSDIRGQIFAIQGITGTPMTKALVPRMNARNIVGVENGFSPVVLGKRSVLIPGSTYDVDMVNAVDYLVKKGVLKKGDTMGYVYFPGGYGGAGLKGAKYAAKEHGIDVLEYQVTPSVSDLSSQIHKMASAEVNAIFMSVSPSLLANAAAVSHTAGLDVPIVVPAPNFVPALMDSSAADQIDGRVLVASAYNAWSADTLAMKKVRKLYAKSDQKVEPQQFILLGYVGAMIMHYALQKVCDQGELTRQSLIDAFSKIESFDLHGLAVNVSYQKRSVPPSTKTYITKAKKGVAGGLVTIMDHPFEGKDIQSYIEDTYK